MIQSVKYYSFSIVIANEPEDPGYFAYSPTLPGCSSNGRTVEETRANMRSVITEHAELMIELGQGRLKRTPNVPQFTFDEVD